MEHEMTAFDRAWELLKEGLEDGAKWFKPNTFDADDLRRYRRYCMDNFGRLLDREDENTLMGWLYYLEQEEKRLRNPDGNIGFFTPELIIGNINAMLERLGLLNTDLGGMV
jgi:hypothetical protein